MDMEEDKYLNLLPAAERDKRKKQFEKLERKKLLPKEDRTFEVVPRENYEDWDVDDLAETLVLAKKMLRKKDRNAIIDANYNKNTTDDHDLLPDWFVQDEKRHVKTHIPVTKSEVLEEKQRL